MSTTDPTLQTLDRFENADLWEVRDNVPIFDAHEEHDASGAIVRSFALADLEEIASNCNRREIETGDAVPITIGHTQSGAPETEQPPIVGYARRFRVGKFGPQAKTAILATFYFFKDRFEESLEYPRRSVELWMRDKIIDPIALLKRTPKRDLGLLTYEQQHQRLVYSMDQHCDPEDMVPHPYPDYGDGEHGEPSVDRVMKYMGHHPVWKFAHQCYQEKQKYDAGSGGPGFASASNTYVPGMGMPGRIGMSKDQPVQQHAKETPVTAPVAALPVPVPDPEQERVRQAQHDIELARYQREAEGFKAANEALQARLGALEKDARVARYERDLGHLISQGYQMDLAEELAEIGDYTADQFAKHVDRVKKRYQRKPIGREFLPVAGKANEGGIAPDSEEDVTPEQAHKAVSLTTRQGSEFFGKYDEALKFVRTK